MCGMNVVLVVSAVDKVVVDVSEGGKFRIKE